MDLEPTCICGLWAQLYLPLRGAWRAEPAGGHCDRSQLGPGVWEVTLVSNLFPLINSSLYKVVSTLFKGMWS